MPAFDKHKSNQIFPATVRDTVLIVTPQGDAAGYGSNDFYRELNGLISLLEESEELKHVLVDLSGANYFGSNVIGAIASLGIAARNRGGRFLIAGASQDMTGILEVMKIDALYTSYPSRKEALDEVAPMSIGDWFKVSRKPLLIGLSMVLVIGGLFFFLSFQQSQVDQRYYDKVAAIWNELKENRERNVSPHAWANFQNRSREELNLIVRELKRTARVEEPIKQELLWLVHDEMLPIIETNPEVPSPKDGRVDRHLKQIKMQLDAQRDKDADKDELRKLTVDPEAA